MAIKFYEYKNCDTCRKAGKYLDSRGIAYVRVPIVETPPTPAELKLMLGYLKASGGSFKNLFNTSGQQYRELDIAAKIQGGMTEAEALALLAKNGKLIKRPFLLADDGGAVGFRADAWDKIL